MDESQLRCLIAAGGTAGHVLPALAVADALRERGVHVTFAGSPERAEAQLVPAAGYELDTFRISGFPRRPGLALLRALGQAAAAPFACRRIVERRRPDVVLGAGGYVAGPMVLAARTKGVPAALTEADAHLGLANRLAAPFASRVLLAYDVPGRNGSKVPRRRPSRAGGVAAVAARRGAARARAAGGRAGACSSSGARAGAQALNEWAVETFGEVGPGRPAHLRRAGLPRRSATACAVPTTCSCRSRDGLGAALGAADLAVSRAGGSVWELAAAGVPAVLVPYPYATGDHQTKNARHFQRAGGAVVVPETELGRVGRARPLAARRPRPPRAHA